MYSKIIFLTFTACVVNASVITLNNDGDELQTLDDFGENVSFRSCNYKECDQRCRRLKFPGGACVNGRCKCDNFRTSEDFAALIEEYSPWRCNPQECNQRCRRLKFSGGTCVNARCKCDNFRNAADTVMLAPNPTDSFSAHKCVLRICSRVCRSLRFENGTCVNGRCKCLRKESSTTESPVTKNSGADPEDNMSVNEDFAALIEEYSPRRCSPQECNQRCRRLKFPGGTCVNGRCKCDNFRNAEDTVMLALNPTDSYSVHKCVLRICSRVCRSLHFENGTCINGRCKCVRKESSTTESPVTKNLGADPEDNMSVNEEFAALIEEFLPRKCNPQECHQRCRRLKFPGGACVNGRCKCDNFRNVKDVVAESAESNLDPPKLFTMKCCKPRICNFLCRRKRFDSSSCINGRCECTTREPSTTTTTITTTTTESAVTTDSKAEDAEY